MRYRRAGMTDEMLQKRIEERAYEIPWEGHPESPCWTVDVGDGIAYGAAGNEKLGPRYRTVYMGNRHFKLHRLMYFWFSDDEEFDLLDRKQVIRHICDNVHCIRPDHLERGSQADNIQDTFDRKRDGQRRSRKLGNKEVKDIARRLFIEGESQKSVKADFPVITNNGTLSGIWLRKSYKDLLPQWSKPTYKELRI